MILSRNIGFAIALILTACVAGAIGYSAGASRAPDMRVEQKAPQRGSTRAGFSGPMASEVLQIVDGDTFKARLQIWFGQEITTSIRVRGFDAPEVKGKCPEETKAAVEATHMLRDILSSSPVTLHDIGPDKYFGRVVASVHVTLKDGVETDVAQMMIAAGMGRPYTGGTRGSWCDKVAGR